MCPPSYLSNEQTSFHVQFYYSLYNLPRGQAHNQELRMCLADLLKDCPTSIDNLMGSFWRFLADHNRFHHEWLYDRDLETDFLRILGHFQRVARESPLGVEIDFRTLALPYLL